MWPVVVHFSSCLCLNPASKFCLNWWPAVKDRTKTFQSFVPTGRTETWSEAGTFARPPQTPIRGSRSTFHFPAGKTFTRPRRSQWSGTTCQPRRRYCKARHAGCGTSYAGAAKGASSCRWAVVRIHPARPFWSTPCVIWSSRQSRMATKQPWRTSERSSRRRTTFQRIRRSSAKGFLWPATWERLTAQTKLSKWSDS